MTILDPWIAWGPAPARVHDDNGDGFDPWATVEESVPKPIEGNFRDSLVARARKRTVHHIEDVTWAVEGDKKLGDRYDHYLVTYVPDKKRYVCDCYTTTYGENRSRRMCSHVMAVIIYRRENRTDRGGGDDVSEASEVGEVNQPDPVASSLATLPDPSDSIFMADGTPLPEWVTELRAHQWGAIQEAIEAYKAGAEVVWLDAPTGTGKTLIGECIRRMMRERALYVCSSKSLQDQFLRDYPYAKVLKGRSNYPTTSKPFPEFTCADCTKNPADGDDAECYWCPNIQECSYEVAKSQALHSPLAVINTAYLLAEANYVGRMSGCQLAIMDECDVLEKELMGFVEFNLGKRQLEGLGLEAPKKGVHKATISSWIEDELIPAIREAWKAIPPRTQDVQQIRRKATLERMLQDAKRIGPEVGEDNWLRDNEAGPMVLKPVKVDAYGERNLWSHAGRWLCMSATIISAQEMSESLGLDKKWHVVRVPMTFPVENRRIHVAGVANVTKKNEEAARPRLALACQRIAERHEGERILVHTVSYSLTSYLQTELQRRLGMGRRVLSYRNAQERERVLAKFRTTPGAILLAPSFDRGVDLKDDDCRVQVVAKMPFLSLGDRQVSTRLHLPGGNAWYAVQTVRSLVQMTGRAIRSKDDWAVTYILDTQFKSNVYKKHKSLLPSWWVEALDFRFPVGELLK